MTTLIGTYKLTIIVLHNMYYIIVSKETKVNK